MSPDTPPPKPIAAESHTPPSAYRPDIDGLRAIAVSTVVVFHLSKDWMPGGFLGVDIFFVISGFLITQILLRESIDGHFSIVRFYERRVRRIAPALLALLAIVTIACTILLLPLDLVGYGRSVLATLGFVSNFYFWRDGNYFARGAEDKPLLHTWTLGVEEQFYILFPLLVAVLARRPRSLLFGVVLAITAASLVAAFVALRVGAAIPAFYLLPTRAWELGAGALLAMTTIRPLARGVNLALAATGLALILFALVAAPLAMPATIPVALPAVAGAVLLIWTGAAGETPIRRMLGWSIPVSIGLISYSLYLWHWPVIVLYRYYFLAEVGPAEAVGLVIIMLALATASWWFVERPFRTKRFSRGQIFGLAAIGAAVVAAAATALVIGKGFPARLDPAAAKLNAAVSTHYRCPLTQMVPFGARNGCMLSPGDPSDATLVLIGNSHAQMYAPLVADIARARGAKTLLVPANGCAPLVGPNISSNCIRIAEQNLAAAASAPARLAVLAFEWNIADRLVDREGEPIADPKRALIVGLDAAIAQLQASGKRVALIGPIQPPGYDFPAIASRSIAFGRDTGLPISAPEAQFLSDVQPYLAHYQARRDIAFITPHRAQCAEGTCRYMIEGESLFADSSHIARAALGRFRSAFEQGLGPMLDSVQSSAADGGERQ